jgi:hypothetical protein
MKITKSTQDALERHLPIDLETEWGELVVRAQTKMFETGGARFRTLKRGDCEKVLAYCLSIFDAGGVVTMPVPRWWLDVPHLCSFSWTAECIPLRDELVKRYEQRDRTFKQPQW